MFGYYLTCRGKLTMSVNRGKAVLALGRVELWVWTRSGLESLMGTRRVRPNVGLGV